MRIGELSNRTGVPSKTIRYYESAGLVPDPPRTSSGYRDYAEAAEGRLRFIRSAQSIGLSLGEIREVLAVRDRGETPCSHVATLIEHHARELEERIEALDAMRKDLVRLSRRARQRPAREADYCHIIELERH